MYTIFLVEDESGVREIISILLSKALPGCHIEEAPTGLAFIELLQERTPDLVLLDVRLPDASGLSLYTILQARADLQAVPVLFVTANAHLVNGAALAGPHVCLAKPFDMAELVEQVQALLGPATPADAICA